MRVAFCISGLSRGLHFCLPAMYEHIIKPLGADVFIHTWDIDVGGGMAADRFLSAPRAWDSPEDKLQFLQKHSKKHNYPLQYDMDVFSDFNSWNHKELSVKTNNTIPMFYSIYKSNLLKKKKENSEQFKYDLVIRSRFDSLYVESIPQKEILNIRTNKNNIFSRSSGQDTGRLSCRNNLVSEIDGSPFVPDNFAFGSSEAMDDYSDVYLNLGSFLESGLVAAESCLGRQLQEKALAPLVSELEFLRMVSWDDKGATFIKSYQGEECIVISWL